MRIRTAICLLGLAAGAACGSPASKQLGEPCSKAEECASGRCSEHVCKPAHPATLGAACQQGIECWSGRCEAGACAAGSRPAGAPCEHWEQCASGDCTQGLCGGASPVDRGLGEARPREAGGRDAARDQSRADGKTLDARPPDLPAPDLRPPDKIKVLDMCEKMAQAEGITCKPLAVEKITSNQILTAGCYQAQDLVVDSAGTLRLQAELTGGGKATTIIAKTITVEMGGVITADSEGFSAGGGPGHGFTATNGLGSGGGHGGSGGPISNAVGGQTYGSLEYPLQPGSAAGGSSSYGKGGGAIRLCAATKITVDGFLFARGQTSGSGGAGGSLLLISPEIAGGGSIDAAGGVPTSVICGGIGGGGGGGRVAMRTAKLSFTGPISVKGGTTTCYSGLPSGQPGTLFKGGLP